MKEEYAPFYYTLIEKARHPVIDRNSEVKKTKLIRTRPAQTECQRSTTCATTSSLSILHHDGMVVHHSVTASICYCPHNTCRLSPLVKTSFSFEISPRHLSVGSIIDTRQPARQVFFFP